MKNMLKMFLIGLITLAFTGATFAPRLANAQEEKKMEEGVKKEEGKAKGKAKAKAKAKAKGKKKTEEKKEDKGDGGTK